MATTRTRASAVRAKRAQKKSRPSARSGNSSKPSKQRRARPGARRWSRHVTETSDALDLEPDVFVSGSARQIALSLKRSAEHSKRRKSSPYRSAMSMLTFYINRGGKNLSPSRRRVLEQAKDELRAAFDRR